MQSIRHRLPLFIAVALILISLPCNATRNRHYEDVEGHVILVTGDSIAAELTDMIFSDAAPDGDLCSAFGFGPLEDNSVYVINTAVGGARIAGIESRFAGDCVTFTPEIVIINGGTNDIRHMDTPKSTFIDSWTSMLDFCDQNGIRAVVLGIVPCSGCSNGKMRVRDDWNESLKELVSGYDGFFFVDADPYVGVFREGGDEGNLWDIKPEYDRGDALHFNREGATMIARAILDAFKPEEPSE